MECRRRARLALLAAALFLPCCAAQAATPRPRLVLVTTAEMTSSLHGTWLKLIYEEALRQLGYDLELRIYPAARATMLSDAGHVDGELNRAARYGASHPNLVRVDPSHFPITVAAYAARPLRLGDGWQALRGSALRVEYRAGTAVVARALQAALPAAQVSNVPSAVLGLRKLEAGRTDLYVDLENVVRAALASPGFAATGIRQVAVEEVVPMHAYLHARHAALAGRLSAVLARLKRDGFVDASRREALRRHQRAGI